jgi:hypothetical protein
MANLNIKIITFFKKNNIIFDSEDYSTGIPEGKEEEILTWNADKLGLQPTIEQLNNILSDDDIENQNLWNKVRRQRSSLLNSSDWTQIPDYNGPNKTEWATYRQALRDITTQSDPDNIVWPTPPN